MQQQANACSREMGDQMTPPTLPEKPLFHVTEVVWILSPYLGRSFAAIERQINRKINSGEIRARVYLGRTMIARDEVIRIIEGEPV